jgi:urea transporter
MPATPALSGLRGYLFAALCVAVALALRFALDPLWGDRFPFVAFFLAVLVAGQFAEAGASIFTIVLGFVLACWFFVPPRHSLIKRYNSMGWSR